MKEIATILNSIPKNFAHLMPFVQRRAMNFHLMNVTGQKDICLKAVENVLSEIRRKSSAG